MGLFGYALYSPPQPVGRSTFEAVVWSSYDYSALDGVQPIPEEEFLERQRELGRRLAKDGVDAFVAEPGGTTQYYVNVSAREWELSERPFLMVVTPHETFILAPLFEVSRARMLAIPSANETKFVTWAEGYSPVSSKRLIVDESPYEALLKTLPKKTKIIMVDDNVRTFITNGFLLAGAGVSVQPDTIAAIRETKSPGEQAILKAVLPNDFVDNGR